MQEDNSSFFLFLDFFFELYQKQFKIGYYLFYYLRVSKVVVGKMNLYELFVQVIQLGDLYICLMMDMKVCQEDDVWFLCYFMFFIYIEFLDEILRSGELLNMIVVVIDFVQFQELVCYVMMGNLVMF